MKKIFIFAIIATLFTSCNSQLNSSSEQNSFSLSQDYPFFGKYPQSVVKDKTLIEKIARSSDIDNDGYIECDGFEYLKTKGKGYYDYSENIYYYFKVEPILWQVFSDGTLISHYILDACLYYDSLSDREIEGYTIAPNNYEYSNVRAFLNGYNGVSYKVDDYQGKGFYDVAFSEKEKDVIIKNYIGKKTIVDPSNKSYKDYIFLLSSEEAYADEYNLGTVSDRIKFSTDYARLQGAYNYYHENDCNDYYWLRTINEEERTSAMVIAATGLTNEIEVSANLCGVLPALRFDKNKVK